MSENTTESHKMATKQQIKVVKMGERSVRRLHEQVSRGSRDPFRIALSEALRGRPSARDWRSLAKDKPHLWAAAINQLGELAGYEKRSVSVDLQMDITQVAIELARRHGTGQARATLEAMGLPPELLSAEVEAK